MIICTNTGCKTIGKVRSLDMIWPDLLDFVPTGSRKCFCVKYNGGDMKFSIYFKQRNNDENNNIIGKQAYS